MPTVIVNGKRVNMPGSSASSDEILRAAGKNSEGRILTHISTSRNTRLKPGATFSIKDGDKFTEGPDRVKADGEFLYFGDKQDWQKQLIEDQVVDVSQHMFKGSPVELDDNCNWVVFKHFLLHDAWQAANPSKNFVPMMLIFPDQYPELPTNGFYLPADLNIPQDATHFYARGFGGAFGSNSDEMQAMADTNWEWYCTHIKPGAWRPARLHKISGWRHGDNLWHIITILRFQNQALNDLRANLLADLNNEYFACLPAKTNIINDLCIITVIEAMCPDISSYKRQGTAPLKVSWEFMREVLTEADERIDADTVIDVHTHPFSRSNAWFSGTDDLDAFIRTQKVSGSIPSSDEKPDSQQEIDGMFNRSVLALGLDNMRRITGGQEITVAGVGGIGSIIAEHLIHMGFNRINLIGNDTLELTNLNRIGGGTYDDAEHGRVKVEVIKRHLPAVNPKAVVNAYNNSVFDLEVEEVIARSDWIMIATDNHAGRYRLQKLAFKYFVPFMAAGVNITVPDGVITDMSGEVVLIRQGGRVCMTCLAKGYVSGREVKEPAVKTLNTHLATMAVDVLVNQYTERERDAVITVYEDNGFPVIYEDTESVKCRNLECPVCSL